jgi:glycine/D-amino acid oxidase-like deaminating enzyme
MRNTPAPETAQGANTQSTDRATAAALQQLRDEILPEAESAVEEWKEKYTATKAALGFVENQYLVVIAERDALKRENERLRAQLKERA